MGRNGGVAIKEGGWEMWRLAIERRGCIYETGSNKMERMVMPGVGGENNACPLLDSYGHNECS